MPRSRYAVALALGLLLMFATTAAAGAAPEDDLLVVSFKGEYSRHWTNSANDTLFIRAAIQYDTVAEKGRLYIIVACYRGDPLNEDFIPCRLRGGTKIWENFTTGGHISAPIPADDGAPVYGIAGTYRSMVNSNSYNSRGRDISVTFHDTGRISQPHTVCSVPWSESFGTGAGPAC